jgi:hypothetical protein
MKTTISKLFNVDIWRDLYDEKWRIRIRFWKWEGARFKIDYEEYSNFSGKQIRPIIERIKKGSY